MFAIRREDAADWPMPWRSRRPGVVGCSHPDPWPLSEARRYVDEHRSEDSPLAVYLIRGWYERRVYPTSEAKGRRSAGVRL